MSLDIFRTKSNGKYLTKIIFHCLVMPPTSQGSFG